MLPRLLFNCRSLTQNRGIATVMKISPKIDCGKREFVCAKRPDLSSVQSADFSVSLSNNGSFDFWSEKERTKAEVTEKVWEIDSSTSDGGAGDSANKDNNILNTLEDHSVEMENNSVDFFGDAATEAVSSNLDALTTFADFGLGGGIMPYRVFQDALEYLTTTQGLEWIPAIAILTVILRTLTIPGVIGMRRFSARSNNAYPETMKLLHSMQSAAAKGDHFEAKKTQMEYMTHMKKSNINPVRPLLINAPNAIAFASMFYGIRQICTAKVPSLVNGGMLWFTDLSVPDPYFILPVLSCLSMSLIIMSGAADAEMGALANMDIFRKIFMWLPIVGLPFLIFQPAAMFAFWMVSNSFTILLILLLRQPRVQMFCGIPKFVKHDKSVTAHMQKTMNPLEMFKKIRKDNLDRENLAKKVQHYQDTIKKMQEMEKRKK